MNSYQVVRQVLSAARESQPIHVADLCHLSSLKERTLACAFTRACLHSSGPEDHGDDVNHRGEAGIGLFVARGDASKRLDGTEEVFNEVAPLVLFRVMRGVSSGPLAQRNDRLDASAGQALAQPAGIECLVADKSQAGDAGHENVKAGDVVTLARQEHEAHQIAKRIDERRNLRGQAAARLADGLILSPLLRRCHADGPGCRLRR